MTLTGLQSTDLTTVAFTTEKLIIFRVILWFPIRMRTYWQIVSVTLNCSRHNLQQVYLNALSSKKYPVLRVTVCNCKKIFQCLLKKNGFYGFDEYELPLKYELPHLLYPLPQGVRKIGPPPLNFPNTLIPRWLTPYLKGFLDKPVVCFISASLKICLR